MQRITAILLSSMLAASGQQPQQGPVAKFTSTSQLVIEVVTVHDRNGAPIKGLTARDFTVTENGAPQTVTLCEFQELPEGADPASARPAVAAAAPSAQPQITPEVAGDIRYRNRRLLTLYFDMSAMPPPDQMRAFAGAQKFIKTQLTPADLVAVMEFSSGAVKVRQDFTGDRDQSLMTISAMIVAAEGLDEDANDNSAADTVTRAKDIQCSFEHRSSIEFDECLDGGSSFRSKRALNSPGGG